MPRLRSDDVHLNVAVRQGPADGPVLLLLHGFTGSIATWQPHMEALAADCTTIAIDALGHGDSDTPPDPRRYRMEYVVADTLRIADQLGIDRFGLVGYSMGGRMALHIAAASDRVTGLVLESASPGLATPAEREARVAADEELATLLETEGIDAFVERWERLPLFASQATLSPAARLALRTQRSSADPCGLANSLRGAGTGAQPPLHERLGGIRVPTLLIAGELDHKFVQIARQMHAALPDSRLETVAGAGHAVHLEDPPRWNALVRQFIRSNLWHP